MGHVVLITFKVCYTQHNNQTTKKTKTKPKSTN